MKTLAYTIHLDPDPEGGYVVTVPALPGCVTWGKDYDRALDTAKEAIECFLESLVKEGEPVPEEATTLLPLDTSIRVQVPAHV